MNTQPATRALVGVPSSPRHAARAATRDTDAFLVTVLTIVATLVAVYDLLLLGAHVHG